MEDLYEIKDKPHSLVRYMLDKFMYIFGMFVYLKNN